MWAQTITLGVFGLFHATRMDIGCAASGPLAIQTSQTKIVLEGRQHRSFVLSDDPHIRIEAGDFLLIVPGKIQRAYAGRLTLEPDGGELRAVIEMDLETAVASVVAAESVPGAPLEALKAQAVVARSFYTASPPRHSGFSFCDTTHCQFLRERPPAGSPAAIATQATRGLLLTYNGRPFAPLYSAVCGGRTLTPSTPPPGSNGYPYPSVVCQYCRRHLEQPVRGHRLGMCQEGAAAMARAGASFREILDHYYPGSATR